MFKSLIPTSLSIYRNLSKIQKNIYVTFLHIFVFPFFVSRYFSVLLFDFFSIFFSILLSKFKLYFSIFFLIFFSFKCIYKTATPKCTFSKLLSQKIHFLKIALSENTFAKFLSEIMKNNFSKCIFKIVCLKNIFSKLLPQKFHFWNFPSKNKTKKNKNEIAPTKKTFPKLFPQKVFLKNCFLKEGIFKKH